MSARCVIANRYLIDDDEKDLLGRGGMGDVYRAKDNKTGDIVAVKVLHPEIAAHNPDLLERFQREGEALRQLNHPNIVHMLEAIQQDGRHYLVMDYVEGGSLQDLLETQTQIPAQRAVEIAIDLADALTRAHRLGILHRDLKPANVLLAEDGTPRLSDFGIAYQLGSQHLTQTGILVGTADYLSPELCQGELPDERTDIWSFGVLLFEMLTGRLPFQGENLTAKLIAILTQPVPDLGQLAPDTPAGLIELIARILIKEPDQRISSMRLVGAELEAILKGRRLITPLLTKSVSMAKPRNNLPTQLSKFIGREKEIALLKQRLNENRLVTLIGSGGVGKTRLAIQAGHEVLLLYPGGVWLIELASLTDPDLVPQAMIKVFGLPEDSNRLPQMMLADHLREKTALLVLDNCEHLIDVCAQLTEHLLMQCPDLRVLASSREALGIDGEYALRVPSLTLPPSDAVTIESLTQSEAVQLFLDRAASALPGFMLTEANAGAVVEVCRRLDGIALAIELAASRVKLLEVEQIATRLSDAFRLLTGGSRTALPRQQTLRATIDWSYNLLSDIDRRLLRRLAVFAGGGTLEAIEAICSGDGLEKYDVLDLLTQLVNKSLVTTERTQGEAPRYYLLETIRQYADEKLLEAGEKEAVHRHHLEYYMNWAEHSGPKLRGPQQVAWLKILDLELGNLRQGLSWGYQFLPEFGLRLATALYRYWRVRNLLAEGMDWLTKLVNLPENNTPTPYRARALGVLSSLGFFIAPTPEAWANESLEISERLHDEPTRAFALWMLGTIAYLRYEQLEQGRVHLFASLDAYRAINDSWGMAQVLYHLANLAIYQGDAITQRNYLEQCLDLYRSVGDLRGIATALDNLASAIADIEADLQKAQKMVEEALVIYRHLNARASMHNALYVYAYILAWKGEFQLARQTLQERLEIVCQSGSPLNIVLGEVLLAGLDRLAGREEQAVNVLEESLRTMKASDPRLVQNWHYSRTLHELAYILARRGDTERAGKLLQEALDKNEIPEERAILFHCRGTVAIVEKNGSGALADFLQSLEICRSSNFKLTAIIAMEGIANALSILSVPEQATRLLSATAAFRAQIGALVSPWDQPVLELLKAILNDQLGKAAFAEAWTFGQAFSFDQAIDEALAIQIDSA